MSKVNLSFISRHNFTIL